MAARSGTESDTNLAALDAALRRLTRRLGRQRQQIQQMPQSSEAWQRWSARIDEGLGLVAHIERAPAHGLSDLAIKFRAILWCIQTDEGVILDEGLLNALRRFERQLARMARN